MNSESSPPEELRPKKLRSFAVSPEARIQVQVVGLGCKWGEPVIKRRAEWTASAKSHGAWETPHSAGLEAPLQSWGVRVSVHQCPSVLGGELPQGLRRSHS